MAARDAACSETGARTGMRDARKATAMWLTAGMVFYCTLCSMLCCALQAPCCVLICLTLRTSLPVGRSCTWTSGPDATSSRPPRATTLYTQSGYFSTLHRQDAQGQQQHAQDMHRVVMPCTAYQDCQHATCATSTCLPELSAAAAMYVQ